MASQRKCKNICGAHTDNQRRLPAEKYRKRLEGIAIPLPTCNSFLAQHTSWKMGNLPSAIISLFLFFLSNFTMHLGHLGSYEKANSDFWDPAFLTSFQVGLALLVRGPHYVWAKRFQFNGPQPWLHIKNHLWNLKSLDAPATPQFNQNLQENF